MAPHADLQSLWRSIKDAHTSFFLLTADPPQTGDAKRGRPTLAPSNPQLDDPLQLPDHAWPAQILSLMTRCSSLTTPVSVLVCVCVGKTLYS